MKVRRKIEMIVEHDETFVVRRKGGAVQLWCSGCQDQVTMLRVEDAAAVVALAPRTIYRWVEAGKLHFTESDKGLVLVCAHSLAACVNRDRTAEKKMRILEP